MCTGALGWTGILWQLYTTYFRWLQYFLRYVYITQELIQLWLQEMSSEPLTLKALSRAAIFRYTPYYPTRHTRLQLPHALLNYLSFSDIIDERIYKLRPLKEECPADCHFHHPSEEIQCGDIEVSDLDDHTDLSDSSDDDNVKLSDTPD